MNVYVTDQELDVIRELYNFHQTGMEGASLDEDQQKAWEEKSASFFRFYDKCLMARKLKKDRALVKKILSDIRKKESA